MKGAFTLALYAAIMLTGGAFGQVPPLSLKTVRITNDTTTVPMSTSRLPPSSDGWPPPDRRTVKTIALVQAATGAATSAAVARTRKGCDDPRRRRLDPGHQMLFAQYRAAGTKVELRGGCYSACTIITSFVEKENLCIAPGAFMAFHAARASIDGPIHGPATVAMVTAYPVEIRRWIEVNGGHDKLPRDGYWTMYDRDLWAMGYPRCK